MKTMRELAGLDVLAAIKPKDPTECSVGMPHGDGLRLGYDGWGDPDVALDPTMTLNVCVDQLGLKGKFERVVSKYLVNNVHGDCVMTHTVEGLLSLVAPGGSLVVEFLSTAGLAGLAIGRMGNRDFRGAQVLEKYCFRQPLDRSGLIYHQAFLDAARLQALMPGSAVSKWPCAEREGEPQPPEIPDAVRLPGVTDEAWQGADANNSLTEDFGRDRPSCILCDRVATKMDHDRQWFSRYCKDHYYEARAACDREIIRAHTGVIVAHKPTQEAPPSLVEWPEDALPLAKAAYRDMGFDPAQAAVLDRSCDGKSAQDVMALLAQADHDREGMIVVGSWVPGALAGVDTFDLAIKHAEDGYRKVRHKKNYKDGIFVVLMASKWVP